MSYFVLIRGPLGVGKTTVARALASALGARLVSIDRILEERGLDSCEEGFISERNFILANEVGASEAEGDLTRGVPAIFDGNFYWRSQVHDLLERLPFPHSVFTLRAPLEVCVQRDAGRDAPHGREGAEAVYFKAAEFDFGDVIDANRDPGAVVGEILSHLPPKTGDPGAGSS